ncbi:hypothetical protein GCM10010259_12740 [Streptomyces daghestanicus]|uniref:Uncharacterized protein n=1 Tax=Streptomyces daghestanicus TaxID=66885 RepID=A0ABQ3PY05_9ACTN|nr:hypothetical protein GCM10010240_36420 [Streptomyces griseoviridis]GGU23884.1 hypothetical protein GCM10010259_12740 [Streptomyces daghestanicus]GHI29905.1 hypothetical protein Sdagh_16350 [Streptomyces daghestanicus]
MFEPPPGDGPCGGTVNATRDLRVDWADDPVDRLGDLLGVWLPQHDDYARRGLDPASSPSYGVPGDPR